MLCYVGRQEEKTEVGFQPYCATTTITFMVSSLIHHSPFTPNSAVGNWPVHCKWGNMVRAASASARGKDESKATVLYVGIHSPWLWIYSFPPWSVSVFSYLPAFSRKALFSFICLSKTRCLSDLGACYTWENMISTSRCNDTHHWQAERPGQLAHACSPQETSATSTPSMDWICWPTTSYSSNASLAYSSRRLSSAGSQGRPGLTRSLRYTNSHGDASISVQSRLLLHWKNMTQSACVFP